MKLDYDRSSDTSRFTLALLLSTTTALLVAAPFVAMFSSDESENVDPVAPTAELLPPAPSLGINESETGRIEERQEIEETPSAAPQTPSAPHLTQTSDPTPDTTASMATTGSTTTIPRSTTTAPSTTVEVEEATVPSN